MKTTFYSKLALAGVVVAVFVTAIFQKVSNFITQGLTSSSSIRVAEQKSCTPASKSDDAHFTGCNSIF